jgi:hypothetical protein
VETLDNLIGIDLERLSAHVLVTLPESVLGIGEMGRLVSAEGLHDVRETFWWDWCEIKIDLFDCVLLTLEFLGIWLRIGVALQRDSKTGEGPITNTQKSRLLYDDSGSSPRSTASSRIGEAADGSSGIPVGVGLAVSTILAFATHASIAILKELVESNSLPAPGESNMWSASFSPMAQAL